MRVHLKGGAQPLVFDVVYPALGCRQRTELARALGLPLDDAGAVDARAPYGTTVAGLYCVGDIVDGLDQISVAMGHGAIAATRAHNYLRAREAERRYVVLKDRVRCKTSGRISAALPTRRRLVRC